MWGACVCALTVTALAAAGVGEGAGHDGRMSGWNPEQLLTATRYSLDSALLTHAGAAGGGAGDEGAAGVRVRGELHVTPLPRNGGEPLIISLEIVNGVLERLTSRSQWRPVEHPRGLHGVWGARVGGQGGGGVYLDPVGDTAVLRDYRRAIASVLLVDADGVGEQEEVNRTGPWGECTVKYHYHDDTTLRSALTGCGDESADTVRVWRYTRDPADGALHTLVAEETVGGAGDTPRARGWLRLTRQGGAPPPGGAGGLLPKHLQLMGIRAEAADDGDDLRAHARDVDVSAAWRAAVAAGAPGAGGTVGDATALTVLLDVIQRATADSIHNMITSATDSDVRCAVLHAVGLAATAQSLGAVQHALQLKHDPALTLAECYFQGLALAHTPHEDVVSWAFDVAGSSPSPRVLMAATLAAYSGSARLQAATRHVRTHAHCNGDHCKTAWLLGMSALPAPSRLALTALMQHALQHEHAHVALLALAHYSLHALPKDLAHKLVMLSLDVPALPQGPRPLEVRAAALIIGGRLTALHTPLSVQRMVRDVTHDTSPLGMELRRLLHHMLPELYSLTPSPPSAGPGGGGGGGGAHPLLLVNGTSSYIVREAWSNALWRGSLTSVTASHGGLLRHQLVTLTATHRHDRNLTRELLRVAVLSRGMASLTGTATDSDNDNEPVDCTIQLSVLGVPLPPLVLYTSTAQLMGSLWAGAGSLPTPALRARLLVRDTHTTARLMLGTVSHRHTVAASVAMDGHGAASLWHRTAGGALALRAAIATNVTVRARTILGAIAAVHCTHTDPKLHIAADVDFYSDVRVCVRAHVDAYDVTSSVRVTRGGRVGSSHRRTLPSRSLSLGDADRLCTAALREDNQ